jgi:hypothetical protein
MFTENEYIAKQKIETEASKKVWEKEFTALQREIIIPKLIFSEQEMKMWNSRKRAVLKMKCQRLKTRLSEVSYRIIYLIRDIHLCRMMMVLSLDQI